MSSSIKNLQEILTKLSIKKLNPMQEEALKVISRNQDTVLLSPTGSGKTLAFLLPLITTLNIHSDEPQILIIVPSRELAIQIEQVIREIGAGFKAIALYGGRSFSKDKLDLKHPPKVIVGTPGRIADHLRKNTFETKELRTLVLDEFDKALEVGFEGEMKEILSFLPNIDKKVLTSATQGIDIPKFAGLLNPITVDYLKEAQHSQLKLETINSPSKDKLDTLLKSLEFLKDERGIIFCNFKDTIERVSDFLFDNKINHSCFYGGMEQIDRERSLIKFRNGSNKILIATDLAARGIDIPEVKYILHYQLPLKSEEFTHRNGRTARMNSDGTAYILKWKEEALPSFIQDYKEADLSSNSSEDSTVWETLFISGGRKDKISKGDVAGLFFKQGNLNTDQVGTIELKQDCAFVAVPKSEAKRLIKELDNSRLKKKKVRIKVI